MMTESQIFAILNKKIKAVNDDGLSAEEVRKITAEELAKQLIPENAQESLNTLEEIAAWIQQHPNDAATMNAQISDNKKSISDNATAINDNENAITELENNKVDKISGKGLSTNDYTTDEKTKLAGIEAGAQVNTITGVKGDAETSYRTGDINITKDNIGLGNVDNTADADKPISTAAQTALDLKADKAELIPNNDVGSYVNFGESGSGWYRIAEYTDGAYSGSGANSCEIILKRGYNQRVNEYHHLKLISGYYTSHFISIDNFSQSKEYGYFLKKIRHVIDDTAKKAYIDVYFDFGNTHKSFVALKNAVDPYGRWKITSQYMGTSDVTSQSTYDIPANEENNKENIYRKSFVTRNVSNGNTGTSDYSGETIPLNGGSIQESAVDSGYMLYTSSGGSWGHDFMSFNAAGTFQGRVQCLGSNIHCGTVTQSGADYAEMWEWLDGNSDSADRVGYFVAFEGDKVRIANGSDNLAKVAVCSSTPSVLGDAAPMEWHGKYLRDEFGRVKYADVTHPAVYEDIEDKDGNIEKVLVREEMTLLEPVVNPDYNPNMEYVPRSKRPEWCAVGTHGKLIVRDDGSCVPDGFCVPDDEGRATAADSGFYVMERISGELIRIYMR